MPTRRDFLKTTAAAGGVLLAGIVPASLHAAGATAPGRARKPMDLLILGGTGFIGPHIVREAISRGHRVTIFTRGRRDAELPPEVIRLVGDRNGKLDALVGKRWDAVIDDSATNPDWVQQSTQLLKDSAGRYLFTSSTGVYYPYITRGVDESTPVRYEQSVDDYDFLAAHGIVYSVPWVMLRGNENGHTSAKNDRAIAAGLTFRPLEATVRDTLAWWPTVPEERRTKAQFAIKPEQESKALADWHALGK
jgi:hypothetical protein